jgi:hypothetical protein
MAFSGSASSSLAAPRGSVDRYTWYVKFLFSCASCALGVRPIAAETYWMVSSLREGRGHTGMPTLKTPMNRSGLLRPASQHTCAPKSFPTHTPLFTFAASRRHVMSLTT